MLKFIYNHHPRNMYGFYNIFMFTGYDFFFLARYLWFAPQYDILFIQIKNKSCTIIIYNEMSTSPERVYILLTKCLTPLLNKTK